MGNRLTQASDRAGNTTTYTYDNNNRLTVVANSDYPWTTTYTYDANGNLNTTSAGQSFSWDVFNRMTSAAGSGGTATYTYNGDGLKIRRIGPDGTTRYYYDGIRPIWEANGAGSMTAQLDRDIFGNLLSRKEPAGTRRYYHFDGLGSTTALSDESGAAVATLLYDAWGNQRAASGAAVPNYRFAGAELDTANGLYHMGARFYDPTIGRWLSEDPRDRRSETLALNLYAYASNNPAILIDPSGLAAEPGSGGQTPAEQRLQAFINAMIFLEELIDYLISRGMALSIGGVTVSANELRRAQQQITQAPMKSGYTDFSVMLPIGPGVNFNLGLIKSNITGDVTWYAGIFLGSPGATVTFSTQNVTPGWNVAVGGSALVFAGQIGTAFKCPISCAFVEVGWSFPPGLAGWGIAIIYIAP